ncbi:MAG: c-type cytochrome domain-containing protein [Verrucomicrobiota bacterium]|nr:c-type cytochrome domain-containing protein [Verrucomicrobiota bacterium]
MRKSIALIMTLGALGLNGLRAEVDFAKSVQSVFEARCIDCHGSKKQKGDLRLDSMKAAASVIEPGKSGESELFKRITLPADHEDIMPPKGDPLSKEQIDGIKAWIDEGAKWPEGLVLLSEKERAEAKAAAGRLPVPDIKAAEVSDAEKAAIAKLSSGEGIGNQAAAPLVMALAQDTQLIYANFRLIGKNVEDKHIAPLADIANLSELDLSNTKVTGAGLATIKNSKRLTKLSLAGTAVDDAALKNIEGLTNLMSINLYNTKVTDAGLASLKNMKFLRKVYGWQSGITEKGAAELKKALPNVDVNLGFKLAKVEPKEEKKEEVKQVSFNKKCPVSGKDIDPTKLYTINFCCNNCLGNFTKDPAKHVAKLKGSDNKKCIFQDKDVDAGKKFVIGFCCGNCLGGFTKDPAKHIAKVKK